MSLQNADYTYIPELSPFVNGMGGGLLIDASGERAAMILQAPKTGTITGFGFRVSGFTTTASPDCRIETVDAATGDPTGTLWGTTTNGTVSVTATGWYNVVLTSGASVTKGDRIAIVIVQAAGNFTIANYILTPGVRFPYADLYTTVWTKSVNQLMLALNYGGTYYPTPYVLPHTTMTSVSYDSGSATDEYGNKITLPFAYRIKGAWFFGDLDGDADLIVYQPNGTVGLSLSIDNNIRAAATAAVHIYEFASTLDVVANSLIRAALLPTTVTSLSLYYFEVNTAAILGAVAFGSNIIGTKRVNAGSWTDETIRQYSMGLIIERLDDGAGGGGGGMIVHPSMTGGCRG